MTCPCKLLPCVAASLLILCAAALAAAAQPAPADRAKVLKENLKQLNFEIHYYGPKDRVRSLLLRTAGLEPGTAERRQANWPAVQITEAEGEKIIDFLAERGWIASATDATLKNMKMPKGPVYYLALHVQGLELVGTIGFDKVAADMIAGVRAVVGAEAAAAIDDQLKEAPIPTTQPAKP